MNKVENSDSNNYNFVKKEKNTVKRNQVKEEI